MKNHQNVIWSSEIDIDDWRDFLSEEFDAQNLSEEKLYCLASEYNNDYLNDERANLSSITVTHNGLCVVASIGTWRGRFSAIPKRTPNSVSDCLRSFIAGDSEITFFVDEKGEFRAEEIHHDGTNYYWFRAYKDSVTDAQKDRLKTLICEQKSYEQTLRRFTYRLGDLIGDIYGWTFPHRPKSICVMTR